MSRFPSTRMLLTGGVVGPVLFLAVFTVLGAIRPGYDPMRMFVSLLMLSDGGWVQVASFLMSGLLILGAAIGLRRVLTPGPGCRLAPIGVGLAGVGLIVAGIFPTDPVQGYPPGTPLGLPLTASWHAVLHVLGALLFFGGLPKGTTTIEFPSNVLHYREVQVHGSYASRHRDQVHALDMLADDIGGLRAVVSDVVDLDAALEQGSNAEVVKAMKAPETRSKLET